MKNNSVQKKRSKNTCQKEAPHSNNAHNEALLLSSKHAQKKESKKRRIDFLLSSCTLGTLLVALSEKGICAVFFGDSARQLQQELHNTFPNAVLSHKKHSRIKQYTAQIIAFITNPTIDLQLPLDIQGTVFQKRVWRDLQTLPIGTTAHYTEIARRIGSPKAIRAVANACAANLFAVIIPCHRVIRKDGGMSGYRWGIERKRILLEKEATTRL